MKTCDTCKIDINTEKKQCPICFNELEGEFDEKLPQAYSKEKHIDNTVTGNFALLRIFVFLSISIVAISGFINFLIGGPLLWSVVVCIGILYVWILIKHTILSKRGIFEKIFFQFVSLMIVVLMTNWLSGGQDWFWNLFVPIAAMTTSTVLILILLVNKKRSDFVLSSFVMGLLLIIFSLVLLLTNVDSFKLLNMINLMYSGLFLLGILVFGFKSLKRGLQKSLHM